MRLMGRLREINWLRVSVVVVAIIFLVLTIRYIVYLVNQRELKKYELFKKTYADSIHYYKDKNGDTIVKIFEKSVPSGEVSIDQQQKLDSLSKVLQITTKERDRYIEIASEGNFKNASSKRDTIYVDSSKNPIYHYNYNDRFLSYDALAGDSLQFKKFIVKDSIYGFFTQKKIGTKSFSSLTLKNTNPSVKITGLQDISYEQPTTYSRWSIIGGVGVGSGFNLKPQPVIMVGVGYNFIRFKKKVK